MKFNQVQRLTLAGGQYGAAELPALQTFVDQAFSADVQALGGVDQCIAQIGVEVQGLVGGNGPSGGGPNDCKGLFVQFGQTKGRGQFVGLGAQKRHIQGVALFVGVFNFKLGQGRAAIETPVHRLQAAVHKTALDHPLEGANLPRFVGGVHGAVRALPVAQHP